MGRGRSAAGALRRRGRGGQHPRRGASVEDRPARRVEGIRRLERQAGAELVHRSPQGIELTPAGTLLLAEARDLLERIGRIVEAVRDTAPPRRRITVGLIAGSVAAAELTKQDVDVYRRRHPFLAVSFRELTFPEQFAAVEAGEVDVALVRPPYGSDDLAVESLFDEPLVLCCGSAPGFVASEMTKATAGRMGATFDEYIAANAEQIPVKRVGAPDDIANAVSSFASEASGYVSGQVLYVAGGPMV